MSRYIESWPIELYNFNKCLQPYDCQKAVYAPKTWEGYLGGHGAYIEQKQSKGLSKCIENPIYREKFTTERRGIT